MNTTELKQDLIFIQERQKQLKKLILAYDILIAVFIISGIVFSFEGWPHVQKLCHELMELSPNPYYLLAE